MPKLNNCTLSLNNKDSNYVLEDVFVWHSLQGALFLGGRGLFFGVGIVKFIVSNLYLIHLQF